MGQHWYDQKGDPCHMVPNKSKGGLRPTTIRDAKSLKLVPSVTSILSVQDKPGLNRWLQDRLLEAAAKDPYDFFHKRDFEKWSKDILYKAAEIGRDAAEKGHQIHDHLESYFKTGKYEGNVEFIKPIINCLTAQFPGVEWVSEESFISSEYGFGGRIDLYSPSGIVLDFKTKDTDNKGKMIQYDDHHMQTSAYALGLIEQKKFEKPFTFNEIKRYNLFISTRETGLFNLVESPVTDKHLNMFLALNQFWHLKHGI